MSSLLTSLADLLSSCGERGITVLVMRSGGGEVLFFAGCAVEEDAAAFDAMLFFDVNACYLLLFSWVPVVFWRYSNEVRL